MLSLSPELLAITVVVFLFMVYVLNIILYKPIFAFLKSRESVSLDYQNKIEGLSKKIEEFDQESRESLLKAREEAKQIRGQKVKEVNLKVDQEIAIFKRQMLSSRKVELEELEVQKNAVLEEVKKDLPEFSKLLSNKLV
ncbi:MAG: Unknown protein [uncultured Campylobacterales bacterium]|uniref:Uncharacterized protein n=1 Tax=uncultured Campylobacterales bacterium TaxID=352960 RepID=A0A6S6SEL7_9BACT|nr:MAG: Unknown protein [uncultured Campylobacterales bacterium]